MSQEKHVRTMASYLNLLDMKSESTRNLFSCTINNIKKFGKIDLENLHKYDEESMLTKLQEWIIWNKERSITASSIMCYFNTFRSYLWYHRIRIERQDIYRNIKFPKMLYEIQSPITKDEIQNILDVSRRDFQFQLLALISSGMRISELGEIKQNDMDFSKSNIIVHIPAQVAKNGRARITFFSKQVSNMIRYRLKSNDEFSFCGERTKKQTLNLIIKRFAASRKKSSMLEKYNHCKQNRYKIHVHTLRSFFITKLNQNQFGLGHILAGHDFYMKGYNRYTVEELFSMYKQVEPKLTF